MSRLGFFNLPLEIRELVYANICLFLGTTTPVRRYHCQRCSRGVHLTICRLVSRDFGHELLGIWAETANHEPDLEVDFWCPDNRKKNCEEHLITSSQLAYELWTHLRAFLTEFESRWGRSGRDAVGRIRRITFTVVFEAIPYREDPIEVFPRFDFMDVARKCERLDVVHKDLRVEVNIICTNQFNSWVQTRGSNGEFDGGLRLEKSMASRMFVMSPTGLAKVKGNVGFARDGGRAVAAEWCCVSKEPMEVTSFSKRGHECATEYEYTTAAL
ncbi:hypothetical protein LTR49_010925 [Elasticomyces elasticus]|nr:hypothetical protein LTR49_010925 [Elasticomyces elasticus]KAK5758583.1 hypothetical protein LTS12_011282 [Elasticomyces elasticus]